MVRVHVVCAPADEVFVRQDLLPFLQFEGWTHWSSACLWGSRTSGPAAARALMAGSGAVVVVVSQALFASADALAEWRLAVSLRQDQPVLAVLVPPLNLAEGSGVATDGPAGLPIAWTARNPQDAQRQLLDRLPVTASAVASARRGRRRLGSGIEVIPWREEAFSAALAAAADRHDHARMAELVAGLASHLKRRSEPYPVAAARADLTTLRQERAFDLLVRAARAFKADGLRDARVRRLGAQGLLETRRYTLALAELRAIAADADTSRTEGFEARGLIGRLFKQRYVDAVAQGLRPNARWLRQAIESYGAVYELDRQQVWHGVNTATCLRRGLDDGLDERALGGGERRVGLIAQQVVDDLAQRAAQHPLEVWDAASRVEALLLLRRADDARGMLDHYLQHPDMKPFEVSSTLRQFEQVLQLHRWDEAAAADILARLHEAVQRYRAGSLPAVAGPAELVARSGSRIGADDSGDTDLRSLVIRVGSPGWVPAAVAGLTLQARLGTVVTARGSTRSVRELLADPGVISVDESRPLGGAAECVRSLPFIGAGGPYAAAGATFSEHGDAALIAFIDDGIDVLHEAFLDDAGRSRIVGIWDQRNNQTPPAGFSYGHYYDAAAIETCVKSGQVPAVLGRNVNGHGTHVASIAAGRAVGKFAGGVAPSARLLVVISAASGPIGYSTAHIEALAFIDRMATQLALPVVVNVSQGMNAGAHDGRSALEVAFDAFSESGRRPGRVVVKSAGNEREKRGHAKVTLRAGAAETLTWRREVGAADVDRIELWWRADSDLRMRLSDPAGQSSDWVDQKAPVRSGVLSDPGPNASPHRLQFTRSHIDNGDSLLSIEIGAPGAPAALGDWALDVECIAARADALVHAWIERVAAPSTPSHFTRFDDPDMTLSIPATAASVIAVAAVDASKPLRVSPFSSYGPTRDQRPCPTICAPGQAVRAACGGTADGVRADDGTSMAAPHVSGAIALALSRGHKAKRILGANQMAAFLRHNATGYNGNWDRGQGWGLLDVPGFLQACEF